VFAINTLKKLSETDLGLAVNQAEKLNDEFCGMSASSAHSMGTEFKTSGRVRTACKKCRHKKRAGKYAPSVKTAVQRTFHRVCSKNILPTMDKVLHSVNSGSDLPNFSRSTLCKLYIFQFSVLMNI
jgi:hypothetical protein